MKKHLEIILLLCLWFAGKPCRAQHNEPTLRLHPTINGVPLHVGDTCKMLNGSLTTISMLRFYVSSVRLLKGDKVVWAEPASYHLADLADPGTLNIPLATQASNYDAIELTLGIDSATNVSGAMGGDLDPVKGMYWSWQSGYIDLKIEGTNSHSPEDGHAFRLHLGGYMPPYDCARKLQFSVKPGQDINIDMNIGELLESIDPGKQHNVVTPGKEASDIMNGARHIFSIAA